MIRRTALVATMTLAAACAATPDEDLAPQEAATGEKPAADPDQAPLGGKQDAISSWWTTLMGELTVGDSLDGEIDYPDWFHGYTLTLEPGQTVAITLLATHRGAVRIYGPAKDPAAPIFKGPAHAANTSWSPEAWFDSVELTSKKGGTYLLVYGPRHVWNAQYRWIIDCVEGCDQRCESDGDCAADEYCGHNGVYCFTTPCDVSFDICQPKVGLNESCHRSEMCSDGLACINDECAALKGGCETDEDCAGGFCGCTDVSCTARECKAWQVEGESCGGFVPAHLYTQCDPELSCVAPSYIADIPGNCGIQVTVEELLADPEAYNGRFVAVEGSITPTYAMCTKMACSVDNPCCNSCGASQGLFPPGTKGPAGGPYVTLYEDGEELGCGGNECTYMDNCAVPSGEYWMAGWFGIGQYSQPTLKVQRRFQSF